MAADPARIAAMAKVSRRGLFRLDWSKGGGEGSADGAARAEEARRRKAAVEARWEPGAPELMRALEPLAAVVCDVAGRVGHGAEVLDVGAGDGNVALEADS